VTRSAACRGRTALLIETGSKRYQDHYAELGADRERQQRFDPRRWREISQQNREGEAFRDEDARWNRYRRHSVDSVLAAPESKSASLNHERYEQCRITWTAAS
jgi:hypothetical protein